MWASVVIPAEECTPEQSQVPTTADEHTAKKRGGSCENGVARKTGGRSASHGTKRSSGISPAKEIDHRWQIIPSLYALNNSDRLHMFWCRGSRTEHSLGAKHVLCAVLFVL